MLDEKVFMVGMGLLMGAYPEFPCTEETLEVYRVSLQDFDPQDFERLIRAHINQNKWFPKICELREELVRLRGFARPTAADEWERLSKEHERPALDETTQRALDAACGGWGAFTMLTYKDLPFARQRFIERFNEIRDREDRLLKIGLPEGEDNRGVTKATTDDPGSRGLFLLPGE